MIIKIIGFGAATLTTVAFIPQAVRTLKTKSTNDISFWMFMLLFAGLVLWLSYGLLTSDIPIILANAVTLLFAGIILFYIIKPQKTCNIAHIALWAKELETMKNFYTETFSAKAGNLYTNPSTGFSSYFLSFGTGARIEIMHKPGHNFSPSENHFAIAAGSRKNVDKITARLLKQGEATMVSWPRKTGDGYYETIFKDPEGNLFEITI